MLSFISSSQLLFFVCGTASVLYDIQKEVELGRTHERAVTCMFYEPTKDFFVTAYESGDIVCWKVLYNEREEKKLMELATVKMHKKKVLGLSYHTTTDILSSTDDSTCIVWRDFLKSVYDATDKKMELELHFEVTKDRLDREIIEKLLKNLKQDKDINEWDFPKIAAAKNMYDLFKTMLQSVKFDPDSVSVLDMNMNTIMESLKIECQKNYSFFNDKRQLLKKKFGKSLVNTDQEALELIEMEYQRDLEAMKKKHERELKRLEQEYRIKREDWSNRKLSEKEKSAKTYLGLQERFKSMMKGVDTGVANSIKNMIIHFETKLGFDELPARYKLISKISDRVYSGVDLQKRYKVAIKVLPGGLHMTKIDHEGIVPVYDILTFETASFVVMELEHENLLEYVNKHQTMRQKDIQLIMKKILCALDFIHKNQMVHRDLCLESVLLKGHDEPKLVHFGVMKTLATHVEISENGLIYTAPEVFLNKITPACDIWSLGILFGYLLQTPSERIHHPLVVGKAIVQVLKSISEISSPSLEEVDQFLQDVKQSDVAELFRSTCDKQASPLNRRIASANRDALDLLERMLEFMPNKRITIKEALLHHYFK